MSYAEDILKLRVRIKEAMESGALDETKETFEAVLIQIMNDAERNRQNMISQSENLRQQASKLDGQAAAFASVVSIVYNVINGYIKISERAKEEAAAELVRVEEEKVEKAEAIRLEALDLEAKKSSKPNKKK